MTPELKDALQQLLTTAALGVLGLLGIVIPYGLLLARKWILSKLASIDDEQARNNIIHAVDRLNGIIETVVAEINQTARQSGADGKLTREEAQELKRKAASRIGALVPAYMHDSLRIAFGDLNRYVSGRIESEVLAQKKDGRA